MPDGVEKEEIGFGGRLKRAKDFISSVEKKGVYGFVPQFDTDVIDPDKVSFLYEPRKFFKVFSDSKKRTITQKDCIDVVGDDGRDGLVKIIEIPPLIGPDGSEKFGHSEFKMHKNVMPWCSRANVFLDKSKEDGGFFVQYLPTKNSVEILNDLLVSIPESACGVCDSFLKQKLDFFNGQKAFLVGDSHETDLFNFFNEKKNKEKSKNEIKEKLSGFFEALDGFYKKTDKSLRSDSPGEIMLRNCLCLWEKIKSEDHLESVLNGFWKAMMSFHFRKDEVGGPVDKFERFGFRLAGVINSISSSHLDLGDALVDVTKIQEDGNPSMTTGIEASVKNSHLSSIYMSHLNKELLGFFENEVFDLGGSFCKDAFENDDWAKCEAEMLKVYAPEQAEDKSKRNAGSFALVAKMDQSKYLNQLNMVFCADGRLNYNNFTQNEKRKFDSPMIVPRGSVSEYLKFRENGGCDEILDLERWFGVATTRSHINNVFSYKSKTENDGDTVFEAGSYFSIMSQINELERIKADERFKDNNSLQKALDYMIGHFKFYAERFFDGIRGFDSISSFNLKNSCPIDPEKDQHHIGPFSRKEDRLRFNGEDPTLYLFFNKEGEHLSDVGEVAKRGMDDSELQKALDFCGVKTEEKDVVSGRDVGLAFLGLGLGINVSEAKKVKDAAFARMSGNVYNVDVDGKERLVGPVRVLTDGMNMYKIFQRFGVNNDDANEVIKEYKDELGRVSRFVDSMQSDVEHRMDFDFLNIGHITSFLLSKMKRGPGRDFVSVVDFLVRQATDGQSNQIINPHLLIVYNAIDSALPVLDCLYKGFVGGVSHCFIAEGAADEKDNAIMEKALLCLTGFQEKMSGVLAMASQVGDSTLIDDDFRAANLRTKIALEFFDVCSKAKDEILSEETTKKSKFDEEIKTLKLCANKAYQALIGFVDGYKAKKTSDEKGAMSMKDFVAGFNSMLQGNKRAKIIAIPAVFARMGILFDEDDLITKYVPAINKLNLGDKEKEELKDLLKGFEVLIRIPSSIDFEKETDLFKVFGKEASHDFVEDMRSLLSEVAIDVVNTIGAKDIAATSPLARVASDVYNVPELKGEVVDFEALQTVYSGCLRVATKSALEVVAQESEMKEYREKMSLGSLTTGFAGFNEREGANLCVRVLDRMRLTGDERIFAEKSINAVLSQRRGVVGLPSETRVYDDFAEKRNALVKELASRDVDTIKRYMPAVHNVQKKFHEVLRSNIEDCKKTEIILFLNSKLSSITSEVAKVAKDESESLEKKEKEILALAVKDLSELEERINRFFVEVDHEKSFFETDQSVLQLIAKTKIFLDSEKSVDERSKAYGDILLMIGGLETDDSSLLGKKYDVALMAISAIKQKTTTFVFSELHEFDGVEMSHQKAISTALGRGVTRGSHLRGKQRDVLNELCYFLMENRAVVKNLKSEKKISQSYMRDLNFGYYTGSISSRSVSHHFQENLYEKVVQLRDARMILENEKILITCFSVDHDQNLKEFLGRIGKNKLALCRLAAVFTSFYVRARCEIKPYAVSLSYQEWKSLDEIGTRIQTMIEQKVENFEDFKKEVELLKKDFIKLVPDYSKQTQEMQGFEYVKDEIKNFMLADESGSVLKKLRGLWGSAERFLEENEPEIVMKEKREEFKEVFSELENYLNEELESGVSDPVMMEFNELKDVLFRLRDVVPKDVPRMKSEIEMVGLEILTDLASKIILNPEDALDAISKRSKEVAGICRMVLRLADESKHLEIGGVDGVKVPSMDVLKAMNTIIGLIEKSESGGGFSDLANTFCDIIDGVPKNRYISSESSHRKLSAENNTLVDGLVECIMTKNKNKDGLFLTIKEALSGSKKGSEIFAKIEDWQQSEDSFEDDRFVISSQLRAYLKERQDILAVALRCGDVGVVGSGVFVKNKSEKKEKGVFANLLGFLVVGLKSRDDSLQHSKSCAEQVGDLMRSFAREKKGLDVWEAEQEVKVVMLRSVAESMIQRIELLFNLGCTTEVLGAIKAVEERLRAQMNVFDEKFLAENEGNDIAIKSFASELIYSMEEVCNAVKGTEYLPFFKVEEAMMFDMAKNQSVDNLLKKWCQEVYKIDKGGVSEYFEQDQQAQQAGASKKNIGAMCGFLKKLVISLGDKINKDLAFKLNRKIDDVEIGFGAQDDWQLAANLRYVYRKVISSLGKNESEIEFIRKAMGQGGYIGDGVNLEGDSAKLVRFFLNPMLPIPSLESEASEISFDALGYEQSPSKKTKDVVSPLLGDVAYGENGEQRNLDKIRFYKLFSNSHNVSLEKEKLASAALKLLDYMYDLEKEEDIKGEIEDIWPFLKPMAKLVFTQKALAKVDFHECETEKEAKEAREKAKKQVIAKCFPYVLYGTAKVACIKGASGVDLINEIAKANLKGPVDTDLAAANSVVGQARVRNIEDLLFCGLSTINLGIDTENTNHGSIGKMQDDILSILSFFADMESYENGSDEAKERMKLSRTIELANGVFDKLKRFGNSSKRDVLEATLSMLRGGFRYEIGSEDEGRPRCVAMKEMSVLGVLTENLSTLNGFLDKERSTLTFGARGSSGGARNVLILEKKEIVRSESLPPSKSTLIMKKDAKSRSGRGVMVLRVSRSKPDEEEKEFVDVALKEGFVGKSKVFGLRKRGPFGLFNLFPKMSQNIAEPCVLANERKIMEIIFQKLKSLRSKLESLPRSGQERASDMGKKMLEESFKKFIDSSTEEIDDLGELVSSIKPLNYNKGSRFITTEGAKILEQGIQKVKVLLQNELKENISSYIEQGRPNIGSDIESFLKNQLINHHKTTTPVDERGEVSYKDTWLKGFEVKGEVKSFTVSELSTQGESVVTINKGEESEQLLILRPGFVCDRASEEKIPKFSMPTTKIKKALSRPNGFAEDVVIQNEKTITNVLIQIGRMLSGFANSYYKEPSFFTGKLKSQGFDSTKRSLEEAKKMIKRDLVKEIGPCFFTKKRGKQMVALINEEIMAVDKLKNIVHKNKSDIDAALSRIRSQANCLDASLEDFVQVTNEGRPRLQGAWIPVEREIIDFETKEESESKMSSFWLYNAMKTDAPQAHRETELQTDPPLYCDRTEASIDIGLQRGNEGRYEYNEDQPPSYSSYIESLNSQSLAQQGGLQQGATQQRTKGETSSYTTEFEEDSEKPDEELGSESLYDSTSLDSSETSSYTTEFEEDSTSLDSSETSSYTTEFEEDSTSLDSREDDSVAFSEAQQSDTQEREQGDSGDAQKQSGSVSNIRSSDGEDSEDKVKSLAQKAKTDGRLKSENAQSKAKQSRPSVSENNQKTSTNGRAII